MDWEGRVPKTEGRSFCEPQNHHCRTEKPVADISHTPGQSARHKNQDSKPAKINSISYQHLYTNVDGSFISNCPQLGSNQVVSEEMNG
jgi:hypothetical protein